ncbi:MAG: thiol:disulfide interchange protein DsbA/DsbL [Burkholderiales bacterium]
MNPSRRRVLGFGFAGLSLALGARAADEPANGTRPKFFPIPPQPVDDPQRIEVREFFYYGCGACYAFEPYLREWEQQRSADVLLVRTPALRTTRWIPLTKVYLVLLKLRAHVRLHQDVFDAYHFDNTDLGDAGTFAEWAQTKDLDANLVRATWDSKEIAMALELTRTATQRYGVQGVPTLIVDGRFLTSPSLAGGPRETIALVNTLIDRRRRERAEETS